MSGESPPAPRLRNTYLVPRERRLSTWAWAAVAVLFATASLLTAAGYRRLASPGELARDHAPVEGTCSACHEPRKGATDPRCLRCHDRGDTLRFTTAAHAGLRRDLDAASMRTASVACESCHTEHRGSELNLVAVRDRGCAQCHDTTWKAHPEFAARTAGPATGSGLRISHARHLAEEQKGLNRGCAACHERQPDDPYFAPISFDRHCASCHLKNGALEGASEPVPPAVLGLVPGAQAQTIEAARGRIQLTGLVHREPTVLAAAERLRSAVDPDGLRAERLLLVDLIARLTAAQRTPGAAPYNAGSAADLERRRNELEQEIAALDRWLAEPSGADANRQTLAEIDRAISTLRGSLPIGPDVSGSGQTAGAEPSTSSPSAASRERRARLGSLLTAIEERGNPRLSARAAELRQQLDAPADESGASGERDLDARLSILEQIGLRIQALPDARGRFDGAQIDAAVRAARAAMAGRLGAEAFEIERRTLLRTLETIGGSTDPRVRARADALRDEVERLTPGGGDGLVQLRERQARALERVKLDLELGNARRLGLPDRPSASEAIDRQSVETQLGLVRGRMADLDAAADSTLPASLSREEAQRAIPALLSVCSTCHELSGSRLSPVAAARPVLLAASFSHKPHVATVQCQSCHETAAASALASDVNLPSVAKCQTCHGQPPAPASCQTCHRYHRSPGHIDARRTWTTMESF